jgi:hypothetical protein
MLLAISQAIKERDDYILVQSTKQVDKKCSNKCSNYAMIITQPQNTLLYHIDPKIFLQDLLA